MRATTLTEKGVASADEKLAFVDVNIALTMIAPCKEGFQLQSATDPETFTRLHPGICLPLALKVTKPVEPDTEALN